MAFLVGSELKSLEALVVFIDEQKRILGKIADKQILDAVSRPLKADFKGKLKESLVLYVDSPAANRVLLIGLGDTKKLTPYNLRAAAAQATSSIRSLGLKKNLGILVPSLGKFGVDEMIQAFVEGTILFQLNFNVYKTEMKEDEKKRAEPISFDYILPDKKAVKTAEAGCRRGTIIAEGVNWSRRLIQTPGMDLYPEELARQALKMVASSPSKAKIKTQVWGKKELTKAGFGGLLGVGQGSERDPQFIILEYSGGKKGDAPVVLVGKGITFDSGGLSLKPPQAMETMKYDMAGAASVLGAFKIITDLQAKTNLVCLVPSAENMPSGHAIRPGDILKMASGKTVEVLNTDAEGRLILADALHYAATNYKPRAIIDVATLTGACAAAVGEAAVGLYTNSKKLRASLQKASDEVQENLFPLPDYENFYAPLLKSDVADLKNIGGKEAGASTASIFLKHFVHDVPWAHFDIAGCGWYDAPRDFIGSRGSSGVSIRTMAEFVENHSQQKFS